MANRYAFVQDGIIKESNVSLIHIQNRGHITALYYEVEEGTKPVPNQFQNVAEQLRVEGRKVIAEYVLVDKNVNQLLSELHQKAIPEGTSPFDLGYKTPDILISEVDQVVVDRVLDLVKKHVTSQLNVFAQSRDYDDIISLTTYATSSQEKFRTEGQRGVDLRDQVYGALYGYLGMMMAGEAYIPKSVSEVDALMPALTWE